jgi:N-acetylneuraminic acid mutarotase
VKLWLKRSAWLLVALAGSGDLACGEDTATPGNGSAAGGDGDGDGDPADASAPGATDAGARSDSGSMASNIPFGSWQTLAELPELPRYYVGVAAARGWVFVIAGFRVGPESSAVHAYDIASDSWQRLADLPTPYMMPNVAAVDDRVFVLSARENNQTLEYDFDNDAWVERTPLPVAMNKGPGASTVAVQGDRIFVVGGTLPGLSSNGLNTGVRQDGAYAYDVSADSWTTLPSVPVAVGYAVGAILDGELWVIGGSDTHERTDRVSAYDIADETWSEKPVLPISLSSAAGGVLQGRIYVSGGIASSSGVISNLTFAFDVEQQSWVSAAPMPTPRFAMNGAVVDDKLYVPCGIVGENPESFVPVGTFEVFDPN